MPHRANQTTLREGDPRARQLGRLSAAKRALNDPDGSKARAHARKMNEARRVRQLERARDLAAAQGITSISDDQLTSLQATLELERLTRLTLASSEKARKVREARA